MPVEPGRKLKTIRLLNRSIELKKAVDTATIEFTNPNQLSALKLTGGVDLGATNVVSASTQRLHVILVALVILRYY